ncbi:opine dehydrogenase [Agrobacterium larrymoorei]|uniref:2-dehydropantoate 2-reductase n=1 Tax=Agrobacterium larrymoorei TaxID=160699 RepID=A0AAJ2ER91_9HYPH|nr:NAD/NADP octopine/nopaline dehydrogenase family protein [Agrobacterium larrymoorei]MDR6101861.1 opine dehydrogenase [Agrobacterium larrymoorei]
MKMKVGIVGAGAVAMGYAALLLTNGHLPCIWSPSGSRSVALREGSPLKVTGVIEGEFYPEACDTVEELAEHQVIVLALPAYGHRSVLDRLLPYLKPHHIVIISAHLSFAALYLSKKLAERAIEIPIAVWNTTVLTSKAQAPTEIKVGAIRSRIDLATVPDTYVAQAYETCVALFGDRFVVSDDILTATLSNTNPEIHLGIVLCNLTRVELREVWGQRSHITPLVGGFIEALDRERLSIATAFGRNVRAIADHYTISFGVSGDSIAEIAANLAKRGKDPLGPTDIRTRYVFEDVPYGLVPTVALAKLAGVDVPLHRSGVDILGACYGRDFAAANDLIPELQLVDVEHLIERVANGYAQIIRPAGLPKSR